MAGAGAKTTEPAALANARRWWKARVDSGTYVVDPATVPSKHTAMILRRERLVLEVAGRRVWILVTPDQLDARAVLLANYWHVVQRVLAAYTPAAIVAGDAVRLQLGEFSVPESLTVFHAASKSRYDLHLGYGFYLLLRPHPVRELQAVMQLEVPGGARAPVLERAPLLLTLSEPEVIADIESITAWLRHLVLPSGALDAAMAANPRPLIVRRLADVATAAGNPALAAQLDRVASLASPHGVSAARTGVGKLIVIPPEVADQPRGSGTPWGDAQRMRLARQSEDVAGVLASLLESTAPAPLLRLIAHANEAKAYDAYHSTTMEGYKITKAMADAIVAGAPVSGGATDAESLRAAMAVQGYSRAFDAVLALARTTQPVTRGMILDLNEALFRPSVDAGVVEFYQLRGWRDSAVFLRGFRHVPVNHKKVPDLLEGLEQYAQDMSVNPAVRAVVVHLEFVTIHPFMDGNGRLGRLLMNLELVRAGLPWITVRADERVPFFRAIETAQVDEDVGPFAALLGQMMRVASGDLTAQGRRRGRRVSHRPLDV